MASLSAPVPSWDTPEPILSAPVAAEEIPAGSSASPLASAEVPEASVGPPAASWVPAPRSFAMPGLEAICEVPAASCDWPFAMVPSWVAICVSAPRDRADRVGSCSIARMPAASCEVPLASLV